MAQKRAGKRGREAELEVRLGAQLGQLPFGKLALQEKPETLAKDQTAAAAAELRAAAAREVEQEQAPFAAGKPFDAQFEARGGGSGDSHNAAGQVAAAVPGLQGEARAVNFEGEVAGRE